MKKELNIKLIHYIDNEKRISQKRTIFKHFHFISGNMSVYFFLL